MVKGKKLGVVWLVVVAAILWWLLLSSSPAAAAELIDERPLYGPPTPPSGEVDFEEPTVIASDPDYQAGPGGYYSQREAFEDE